MGWIFASPPCNPQITPIHVNLLFWEFTYPLSWKHLMPLNRTRVWSIAQLYTPRRCQQTSHSDKSFVVCESQLSYMDVLCSCLPQVLALSGIEHAAPELLTLLGGFAKLRKARLLSSLCLPAVGPSVYPHGTTLFPLNAFSCNFKFECF